MAHSSQTRLPADAKGRGLVRAAAGLGLVRAAAGLGLVRAAAGLGLVRAAAGRGLVRAAAGLGLVRVAAGLGLMRPAAGLGLVRTAQPHRCTHAIFLGKAGRRGCIASLFHSAAAPFIQDARLSRTPAKAETTGALS